MPLFHGKKARTHAGFRHNVEREAASGRPLKQSVAIAYSEARRGKSSRHHGKGRG
jgi:hypothetical protein